MALIAHGGPRRITALLHELALLVRPRAVTAPEPKELEPHYPPMRARFIESAAMGREMYRL
jgi:hypothetical protein